MNYKIRFAIFLVCLLFVSDLAVVAEDFFPLNTWVEVKTPANENEQLKISSGMKYNWTQKVRLIRGKKYALNIKWKDSSGRKVGILGYDPMNYDGRKLISESKNRKWLLRTGRGENAEYHKILNFIVNEHSLTDIAFLMFSNKWPGKTAKIMLSDKVDENTRIKGLPLFLKSLSGKNEEETSNSSQKVSQKEIIEIFSWNSGGGSFISPKVQVSLKIHSAKAEVVKLFALDTKGNSTELSSQKVISGKSVDISSKYNRMNTRFFEIRAFDKDGVLLAKQKRSAK